MKRNLSHQQEVVIHLCHHDFEGLSAGAASVRLGITRLQVLRHLCNIRKKAPQLFPILTPRRRAILEMYSRGDFELRKHPQKDEFVYVWKHPSRKAIAEGLGITAAVLSHEVTFLRRHKFLWNHTMKQYDPSMDGSVKEKF